MFDTVDSPCFEVTTASSPAARPCSAGISTSRLRGRPVVVRGVTHLCFDTDGLVCPAPRLLGPSRGNSERLPIISSLMRWLKKRLASECLVGRG